MNVSKITLPRCWRKFFNNYKNLKFYSTPNKCGIKEKFRSNPIIFKLETPEFKNMFTQEVIDLKNLFHKYQYEIRIVGGAVRDMLIGEPVIDLDLATTATPKQMKEIFTIENIRMINLSSEKHGTITVRLNDKQNFEISTLRIDNVMSGKRVGIDFIKDWQLDALRRDFTINSMYLGLDGSVYDYLFGYDDLQKRRIVFVDDPNQRIQEDYLRIIRYFRFYGKIAENPNNHDDSTLKCIKDNVSGLEYVHGSRIWMELKKIFQGNFVGSLLKVMVDVGIPKYIGITKANTEELINLLDRNKNRTLHPISYLAALLHGVEDLEILHSRLPFSNYEKDMLHYIVHMRNIDSRSLVPYQKLILNSRMKQKDAIEYTRELFLYKADDIMLDQLKNWKIPRFPVSPAHLQNLPTKRIFKRTMTRLKDIWIENEFKPTTQDLLKLLPSVLQEYSKK